MPTVMLIAAQTNASEMEMLAPYHTVSKVDWPCAPVPRIQWKLQPKRSVAAVGDRWKVDTSVTLRNGVTSLSNPMIIG